METHQRQRARNFLFYSLAVGCIILFMLVSDSLVKELAQQQTDPVLLKRLSYYPYLQLCVMATIGLLIYSAAAYTRKAEHNRLWAALSKETAHQLSTPISSLMAWNEYLRASGTDETVTSEIEKDTDRLAMIADRFSKIGSTPEMKLEYINDTVEQSLQYMRARISKKVTIDTRFEPDDHGVMLCTPLFGWVIENLTKNAVDAIDGEGQITITSGADKRKVWIEVADTGKGIPRKNLRKIFSAGFTTKKRGWGMGLTLVKRIVEDYHGGRIFVKESESGRGTTFRIELPQA